MRLYLYAYTLADAPHLLDGLEGVNGNELFLVKRGPVAAAASAYPREKLLARGRDVFAHQRVLRRLMEQASVAPLPYGLTLRDRAFVERALEKNEAALLATLRRIYRKVEMEVSLRFEAEDIFEMIASKRPSLRSERAKLVNGRLVSYLGDRARKCERFERALREEKAALAEQAEAIIGPWCAEIERSRLPMAEREVATFDCLVNRERLKVFERSLYEAGERLGGEVRLSFSGPWPPQNFCDLRGLSYA